MIFMANRFKVDCRKYLSEKGCTVTIAGSLDEVVELGWLHAKVHHAHKEDEETGIKDWIRSNAEAAMIRQTARAMCLRFPLANGARPTISFISRAATRGEESAE